MLRGTAVFVAVTHALWCDLPARAPERTVGAFDFELVDTGLQGATYSPSREDRERLASMGEEFRRLLTQTGRFDRLLGPGGS